MDVPRSCPPRRATTGQPPPSRGPELAAGTWSSWLRKLSQAGRSRLTPTCGLWGSSFMFASGAFFFQKGVVGGLRPPCLQSLKQHLKWFFNNYTYSCDSNCRSVANCGNGLKVLSSNGSIRRHGEICGCQHGSN